MKDVNSLACIDTSLFMQVRKVLSAAKDGVEEGMHHQSKERNMSKSPKKKKIFFLDPFGLARFRFNEVRISEVPLYYDTSPYSHLHIKFAMKS